MNSLLFGIALLATPATDTVTLEMMAKPVGEVVAEVARQTQLPITADVTAASRPVFIAVDQMPVKVFLERLAKITDCEWHARGERSVLTRGNRAQAAIIAEQNERARSLPGEIKRAMAELDRQSLTTERGMQQRFDGIMRQKAEADRRGSNEWTYHHNRSATFAAVLREFLARMPVQVVSALAPGDFAVFSTAPNALQLPLPYQPQSLESALAAEDAFLKRLVAAGVRFNSPQGYATVVRPVFPAVSKILIRAEAHQGSTIVNAYVIGTDGQVVGQSSTNLAHSRAGITVPRLPGFNESVPLNAESASFAKAFRDSGGWASGRTNAYAGGKFDLLAPAELREQMRRPAEFEPQRLLIGDLVSGWRRQTPHRLMASFSDGLFTHLLGQPMPKSELRVNTLIANGQHVATQDAHGWLMYPRNWAAADREALDRRALQDLLTSPPNLAKAIAYANTSTARQNSIGSLYLMLLDQPTYVVVSTRHATLRLLGLIPGAANQTSAAWSVKDLPRPARDSALRMLLNSNFSARLPWREGRQPGYVDATESFRFDVNWQLGLRRTRGETLCTMVDGRPGVVVTPHDFGFRTGLPRNNNQWLPKSPVAILSYDEVDVQLGFGNVVDRQPLRFLTPAGQLKAVEIESLPAEMQTAYAAGQKSATQSNRGSAGGRSGNIPPRP